MPSNAEWCELENYVEPGIDVNCNSTGYRGSMAKRLAAPQYWDAYPSNSFAPGYCQIDATGFNTSGFSAIPSGYLSTYWNYSNCDNTYKFVYYSLNSVANFWSCTVSSSGSYNPVYYRSIEYSSSGIQLNTRQLTNSGTYNYAYSVRCIKN